jgi:hypothetical protein
VAKVAKRLRRPGPVHVAVAGAQAANRDVDRDRVTPWVDELGLDDRVYVEGAGSKARLVTRRERPQSLKNSHQGIRASLRQRDIANEAVSAFGVSAEADCRGPGRSQGVACRLPRIMRRLFFRARCEHKGARSRTEATGGHRSAAAIAATPSRLTMMPPAIRLLRNRRSLTKNTVAIGPARRCDQNVKRQFEVSQLFGFPGQS